MVRHEEALDAFVRRQHHTLLLQVGTCFYSFDRTGRFLFLSDTGRAVRRGLDHRMVESSTMRPNVWRTYHDLSEEQKHALLSSVYHHVETLLQQPQVSERAWLERIVSWQGDRDLKQDYDAFYNVYQRVSILPPDQYKALFVQLAEGCSYNRCAFCDFYQDRSFHVKTPEELKEHVGKLKRFFGERLQDRDQVFLGDGNALVVAQDRLVEALYMLRKELPELPSNFTFSTFMDTFHVDDKSLAQLRTIRQLGLTHVYVGLETGHNELRSALKKPGTSEEAAEAISILKSAGFHVGVIVLVGVGGDPFALDHRMRTLDLLACLPLDKNDIIYLSPFVDPDNVRYHQWIRSQGIVSWNKQKIFEEMRRFRDSLTSLSGKPKVTLYSIEEHLY